MKKITVVPAILLIIAIFAVCIVTTKTNVTILIKEHSDTELRWEFESIKDKVLKITVIDKVKYENNVISDQIKKQMASLSEKARRNNSITYEYTLENNVLTEKFILDVATEQSLKEVFSAHLMYIGEANSKSISLKEIVKLLQTAGYHIKDQYTQIP